MPTKERDQGNSEAELILRLGLYKLGFISLDELRKKLEFTFEVK